jgi:hypothetical protein
MCTKRSPKTRPTIALAFALAVHHNGDEMMVDGELSQKYLPPN